MCVFCEIINGNIPTNKVYEDDLTMAFLDLSQTTYGHTLVVPKKHVDNFWDADQSTIDAVMHTVKTVSELLKEKLHCEGMNILTNINPVAGQSVMHFHVHLRFFCNFKNSVICGFRIFISQCVAVAETLSTAFFCLVCVFD